MSTCTTDSGTNRFSREEGSLTVAMSVCLLAPTNKMSLSLNVSATSRYTWGAFHYLSEFHSNSTNGAVNRYDRVSLISPNYRLLLHNRRWGCSRTPKYSGNHNNSSFNRHLPFDGGYHPRVTVGTMAMIPLNTRDFIPRLSKVDVSIDFGETDLTDVSVLSSRRVSLPQRYFLLFFFSRRRSIGKDKGTCYCTFQKSCVRQLATFMCEIHYPED